MRKQKSRVGMVAFLLSSTTLIFPAIAYAGLGTQYVYGFFGYLAPAAITIGILLILLSFLLHRFLISSLATVASLGLAFLSLPIVTSGEPKDQFLAALTWGLSISFILFFTSTLAHRRRTLRTLQEGIHQYHSGVLTAVFFALLGAWLGLLHAAATIFGETRTDPFNTFAHPWIEAVLAALIIALAALFIFLFLLRRKNVSTPTPLLLHRWEYILPLLQLFVLIGLYQYLFAALEKYGGNMPLLQQIFPGL